MRCLIDSTLDPYWNLAVEEFLLTQTTQPVFRLWRNAPAIIVGRNQNTLAEINAGYVTAHHLPVVRRLSGGGAVFHELGNINFSFVDDCPQGSDTSALFGFFTRPVLEFLATLGIKACLEGRNDLLIEGRKFSGNAIAIHKNRILMHGTLLYNASVSDIGQALRAKEREEIPPEDTVIEGRAVASRPRTVCNISEYLSEPLPIETFLDQLRNFITRQEQKEYKSVPYTMRELEAIETLCREKYRTYEWNYGMSPAYNYVRKARFPGGNMEVNLYVDKGIIKSIRIYGDYFSTAPTQEVEAALTGCPHSAEAISGKLSGFRLDSYFRNIAPDAFLSLLLG